jgi:hypothetical protein
VGDLPPGGATGHSGHDPELIVALLDPDQLTADRARALARVDACADCAGLYRDLVAVATATTNLPAVTRPRDFSLTPEVAVSLSTRGAGEPVPSFARLTGEMPATQSQTAHASHDRLLIANLVDRSVSADDRARGEAQLASCQDCGRLLADLLAISEATRSLAVPVRPREFILTAADAERLRHRGWRSILSAIGSSRDAFTRPLAMGLTTIGLAGLLVAIIPGALSGQPTSRDTLTTVGSAAGDAAGGAAANPEGVSNQSSVALPGATAGPVAVQAAPAASEPGAAAPAPAPSGGAEIAPDAPESDRLFAGGESSPLAGEPEGQAPLDLYGKSLVAEPNGPSSLLIAAMVLVLAGLGLFALRWTSRRLGNG